MTMISLIHHGEEAGQFAGLAEIVIDRLEKRNALTPEMLRRIRTHAEELTSNDAARAIVLRGEGKVFCAGFDLAMALDEPDVLRDLLRELSLTARALRRALKPVVIAAHGAAIAGGCALLGGADLVITDRAAKLGYPVIPLGISPAVTAPLLGHSIGMRATRERLLDPSLISGEEARRLGLAELCVDLPEDVTPRAQIEAMKLAQKPAWAYAATKGWLNEIEGSDQDEQMDLALEASLALVGNKEQRTRLAEMLQGMMHHGVSQRSRRGFSR